MTAFNWVEAVEAARGRWSRDSSSFARVVSELESVVDDAEATENREAETLRAIWWELEEINALQLAGESRARLAEVEKLLASFAAQVRRATSR